MKSLLIKNARIPVLLFIAFLFSCNKNRDHSPIIEKEFAIAGVNKVYAMNGFNVIITKGDAFSFKAQGPSTFVNDIDLKISNRILDIQFLHNWNNRPQINISITLPVLTQINLGAAGNCIVHGFEEQDVIMRAVLSAGSKCSFNGAAINVAVDIAGGSQLDVSGSTLSLYGSVSGGGKLNAYSCVATEVDIDVSGGSEAKVNVQEKLFASASGGSRIYYKGQPVHKSIDTSGGGQVIQE